MYFQHPEGYDRLLRWQDHPTLPLRIYNYSPEAQYAGHWDEVTTRCRGLVIDTETREIVANPQHKAFNVGELEARGLALPQAHFEVQDKLDGQLIIVFYYHEQWHVASRGSFTSAYAQKGAELLQALNMKVLNREYTYLFELVGFERIVLSYPKPELVLFGIRAVNGTWDATAPFVNSKAQSLGCDSPALFKVKHLDALPQRNDAEGFVIRYLSADMSNPFRVKLKYAEYVKLHKLMTGISSRTIWEHARTGEDLLTLIEDTPDEYFSWVETQWKDLHEAYQTLWYRTHEEYTRLTVQDDRKKTALAYLERATVPTGALFALLDKKECSDILWRNLEPDYERPFSFNQLSQAQRV